MGTGGNYAAVRGAGTRLAFLLSPCLLISLSPCLLKAWDPAVDSVMYRDPDVPRARLVVVFPERLRALWQEALQRPEADYQSQAALAIARAHRRGMKVSKEMVDGLLRVLERPDRNASARVTAARALVELDVRQAAPRLFRQARQGDGDLRAVVEPALARWDYRPARAVWLERLGRPGPDRGDLVLALRGLAAVGEGKAVPRLRELALSDRHPAPVRLEAARALGALRTSGLEDDAKRLAAGASPERVPERLAAAALLRRHRGDRAVGLLRNLARDPEPAVAAAALERLTEIDPKLVVPMLEPLLGNPDGGVRSLAVEVLSREPSDAHLRLLGDRLDDPLPEVRVKARSRLERLAARPAYRAAVIRQGERALAGRDWRGQEQGAVLLTRLGHKPAARRLAELLSAGRPEVFVAAAWGLRRLEVAKMLPAVRDFVRLRYRRLLRAGPEAGRQGVPVEAVDQQLSQLVQLLGQSKDRAAEATLRQFVPRFTAPAAGGGGRPGGRPVTPVGPEARAAAVWALGKVHEGKPVPELVGLLEERLRDVATPFIGGDDYRVRWMCAVTLGRMKAREALGTLRNYYPAGKPTRDFVNNACGWAVAQITGRPMPPAGTVEVAARGGFLNPVAP